MSTAPVNHQNQLVNYFQDVLPDDVFGPIFLQLDKIKTINSAMRTNRRINGFISNNSNLWRRFVLSDFLYPFPHPLPFMQLYRGLKITNDNVKVNNSHVSDLTCSYVSRIAVHEDKLFYTSTDGDPLQLWDVNSDEALHTFDGHNDVYCFAMDGNILATGSTDGTTKLWDLTTRKELHTFINEEQESVTCLSLKGDFVACGFLNGTIKVWNVKTKEEHFTMTDDDAEIEYLALQDNRIVYHGNHDFKVVDLATGQVKEIPADRVNCSVMQGNTLYACVESGVADFGDEKTIFIRDFDTNKSHAIRFDRGNMASVCCLAVQGNLLFVGSILGDIVIFDLKSKKELQRFEDERGSVSSIAVKDGKLFVADEDGTVKVYDFSAGSALNARSSSSVVHFPFLEELGIRSVKDHLEKLNCLPRRLQKIGIVTSEDLHRICKRYTAVVNQIPLEADVSEDLLQKEKIAGRRKETLVVALETMSNVLGEMTTEAKNSYDSGCPWEGLEKEIKRLDDEIHSMMKGDRKQIVKAFDAPNYNHLASQLNAVIQEFNREVPILHREHQVNKLRAYVDQSAVSEVEN